MKKLIALAVGAAIAPTAAFAADETQMDGFASVALGYGQRNSGHGEYTFYRDGVLEDTGSSITAKKGGLDIEGRITGVVPVSGNFAIQADGVWYSTCDNCGPFKTSETTIAGHVFHRNAERLLGLMVQRNSVGRDAYHFSWQPATYYVGGEAQIYRGNLTVYGQAAYVTSGGFSNYSRNGVQAAVQLRYFPRENLMVALKGSFERTNRNHGQPDSNYYRVGYRNWSLGSQAEYRLPSSRVSLTLDLDYTGLRTRTTAGEIDSGVTNVWRSKVSNDRLTAMVGIKFNFGASSLKQRDRSGASLDPLKSLAGQYNNYY